MVSSEDFERELILQLGRARGRGALHVEINSGELHRTVGGYPGPDHRMASCCDVMRKHMRPGDIEISAPDKGKGASLTVRYLLGSGGQRS